MVTLIVDESFAFDFLSILEVKHEYSKNDKIFRQFKMCYSHLEKQLGKDLLERIYRSNEYAALKDANKETFMLVDMAKTDSCKASDVDKSNYRRCIARKELQNKFFSADVSEVKFGYEKYEKCCN